MSDKIRIEDARNDQLTIFRIGSAVLLSIDYYETDGTRTRPTSIVRLEGDTRQQVLCALENKVIEAEEFDGKEVT